MKNTFYGMLFLLVLLICFPANGIGFLQSYFFYSTLPVGHIAMANMLKNACIIIAILGELLITYFCFKKMLSSLRLSRVRILLFSGISYAIADFFSILLHLLFAGFLMFSAIALRHVWVAQYPLVPEILIRLVLFSAILIITPFIETLVVLYAYSGKIKEWNIIKWVFLANALCLAWHIVVLCFMDFTGISPHSFFQQLLGGRLCVWSCCC